jgi:hypothetical protein
MFETLDPVWKLFAVVMRRPHREASGSSCSIGTRLGQWFPCHRHAGEWRDLDALPRTWTVGTIRSGSAMLGAAMVIAPSVRDVSQCGRAVDHVLPTRIHTRRSRTGSEPLVL